MSESRDKLLAAMYDTDVPEKKKSNTVDAITGNKIRRITVGAIGYDLPSVEYVQTLEKQLAQQDRLISDQAQRIKRLETMMQSIKNLANKTSRSINEVSLNLDNKIDRREG